MTRDQWKLVTSVDELRAGMCVELRPCAWCRKRERNILMREAGIQLGRSPDGSFGLGKAFYAAGVCDSQEGGSYDDAIRERRLYALIDDDTAADETTVTRRRELVE